MIKSKSKGNRYNIKKKVFKRETLVLLAFFVCVSFPLLSSLPAYVDPTSSLGQKVSTITDKLSVDDHYKVDSCTIDQLNKIRSQLKLPEGETGLRKHKITSSTGCPSTRWLSKYYKEYFHSKEHGGRESFLGITIGCNGGFDAIDMARIGTSNAKFDKVTWRAAIGAEKDSGVCRQADDINIEIENNHVIEGEIHCIEPVPTNHERLINASKKAALGESIVMSKAAIASTNGISKFPNAAYVRSQEKDGSRPEGFGVESCEEIQGSNPTACEDVPQYSLQTYVNKFVKSTGTINMLYIDVEGYDFDVLFGAGDVLGRTEYLEFEFHKVGRWPIYHIMDAVNLLDQKGFTCYWIGVDMNWRLTGCHHKFYDTFHNWSNVGCVHRSQKELASVMENVFLETLER